MHTAQANHRLRDMYSARSKPRPQTINRPPDLSFALIYLPLLVLLLTNAAQETLARESQAKRSIDQLANKDVQQTNSTLRSLECEPGEQRHFNYESATKVWGSASDQLVRLAASMRLSCLETGADGSLKYLAEVLSVVADHQSSMGLARDNHQDSKANSSEQKSGRRLELDKRRRLQAANLLLGLGNGARMPASAMSELKAEPVFEEVGEALSEVAERMSRSVSGWFNKTWGSVKDFFVNIFGKSERSEVSREEAFREHGIDIAGHCKAGKGSQASGQLPIDESVFDDLEPKYYIGALSASSQIDARVTLDLSMAEADEPQSSLTESLFDEPKRLIGRPTRRRSRRATDSGPRPPSDFDREQLLRLPFVFLQSKSGRILEVRFSIDELDPEVKNFKRHLCDLFATNLSPEPSGSSTADETTPIGRHKTKYIVDPSLNATSIRKSLKEMGAGYGKTADQLIVKALASMANETPGIEAREPISGQKPFADEGKPIAVLRTINSTRELTLASGSSTGQATGSEVQVRANQVQQIAGSRMVASAGQLGVSLLGSSVSSGSRSRRSSSESNDQPDLGDLVQVSTSFTLKLVAPNQLSELVNKTEPTSVSFARFRRDTQAENNAKSINNLFLKPKDKAELAKTLAGWRDLESRLQLEKSSLLPEVGGVREAREQRVEMLRDQIQMRLNEEYLRNTMRRKLRREEPTARLRTEPSQQQVAASDGGRQSMELKQPNDWGLGLTRLLLDEAPSSRRKGSMQSTLDEALDLERDLDEDKLDGSVSKLMRDTVKFEQLKALCRSSVPLVEELRAQSSRIELKGPFGVLVSSQEDEQPGSGQIWSDLRAENQLDARRVDGKHCNQVLYYLLRAGDRRAADLALDLVDETNRRLLLSAKHEELGHGPASRHFRRQRQLLVELLAQMERPSETIVDKLMARLHYKKLDVASRQQPRADELDFTMVSSSNKEPVKYNRSLLREEDDHNNDDGAATMVAAITQLASKASISRHKKVQVTEKLLSTLKNSNCLLFQGPDLDIIESMANFRDPLEEMVAKVVHLGRRCRQQEQYQMACLHGLQGQLGQPLAQRYLIDLLRSSNSSCDLKSEVVLVLMGAQLMNKLESADRWPRSGINQLDEILLDLVEGRNADRKCLKRLVGQYMESKGKSVSVTSERKSKRQRRAIPNEDNFWDEAYCKRWSVPESSVAAAPGDELVGELADELDDGSTFTGNTTDQRRGSRMKSQRMVERELVSDGPSNSSSVGQQLRRRHKCLASKSFGPKNAEATLRAEVVNDLVGARDENKFLARFRLQTNILGNRIDVGRMYLWHQRRVTRAHVNVLGKSLWDTSHQCHDQAPKHLLYMPLFDFNLWVVKLSVGLKLQSEMGFHSNCQPMGKPEAISTSSAKLVNETAPAQPARDQLELYPRISVRASGEASARFVVARAGLSLASHYGYQGNIRLSEQPNSCMSIYSSHQPMNVTLASWVQLWDSDCHYWGSRLGSEPRATKWRLMERRPSAWLENECLAAAGLPTDQQATSRGSQQTISP